MPIDVTHYLLMKATRSILLGTSTVDSARAAFWMEGSPAAPVLKAASIARDPAVSKGTTELLPNCTIHPIGDPEDLALNDAFTLTYRSRLIFRLPYTDAIAGALSEGSIRTECWLRRLVRLSLRHWESGNLNTDNSGDQHYDTLTAGGTMQVIQLGDERITESIFDLSFIVREY